MTETAIAILLGLNLGLILAMHFNLRTMKGQIMTILDDILAKQATALEKIQANTDLDAAIKAAFDAKDGLIADLRAQLAAAGGDPAKLQQVLDNMDAILAAQDNDTAASAVVAGTDAE